MNTNQFQVELKVVKLTKSKILQMEFIGIPKDKAVEVLGWVNMDGKRWVIIKNNGAFYRADFIKEVEKQLGGVQYPTMDGGYEYPNLTTVSYCSHNRGSGRFSPNRDEQKNLELYDYLVSFKRQCEIAGQIYY